MSSHVDDAFRRTDRKSTGEPSFGKKVFGWIAFTVLCLFSLAVGSFFGFIHQSPFLQKAMISMIHNEPPQQVFRQDKLTLLVLGCDEDLTMGGGKVTKQQARSDMIMVARCDFAKKRISALSIPRDTYYKIPGDKNGHKLNAFHAYGGNEESKRAVEGLLGIRIDRVVTIDFDAFQELVNLLGGVDLTVPKQLDYDDNAGKLHIHLKPGFQHLNGYQAMGFVRFRHSDSDLNRQLRQHAFLMALKERIVSQPGAINEVAMMGQRVLGNEFTDEETIALALFGRSIAKDSVKLAQAAVTEKKHSKFLYLNKRQTAKLMLEMGLKAKDVDEVARSPRRSHRHETDDNDE